MEHDKNVIAFMEKCMSNNLTLNSEKILFKQSKVSFYGHCWSKQGISLDPKKIEALNHMEFPTDKETMRSFLGMVKYLKPSKVHCEHHFLYGKEESTLGTDQKPFVNICKKHRIDLPFKVVYKKGTSSTAMIAIAIVAIMIIITIMAVNIITTRILMSRDCQGSFSNKLDQLRKSKSQDEELTRLKCYFSTGFPCDKKNLPTNLYDFLPHKERLSIESGLITYGNRIIVPRRCDQRCSSTYTKVTNVRRDPLLGQETLYFGPR